MAVHNSSNWELSYKKHVSSRRRLLKHRCRWKWGLTLYLRKGDRNYRGLKVMNGKMKLETKLEIAGELRYPINNTENCSSFHQHFQLLPSDQWPVMPLCPIKCISLVTCVFRSTFRCQARERWEAVDVIRQYVAKSDLLGHNIQSVSHLW